MADTIYPGTATPSHVLSGDTFSAGTNYDQAGTMANNGDGSYTFNGPGNHTLAAGYYSGGTIKNPGWFSVANDIGRTNLGAAYDKSSNLTYAIDGSQSATISTTTAYSYGANAWTTEANDSAAGRNYVGAAYDSSSNLTNVIDGYNGSSNISIVTSYNHSANSWTIEANDSAGTREGPQAVYDSSSDLTYAIDGISGAGTLNIVTAYSHSSNGWTSEANDATARGYHASAYDSSANMTYSIDGNSSGTINTVTAYNHVTNGWTTEAPDSGGAREWLAAAYDSSANLTYAIDGMLNGSSNVSTITGYNHQANSWTSEPNDVVGARRFLAAAYDSIDNFTFSIDGYTSANISNVSGFMN